MDIIAGFFILFEDQYGVGDVIRVEPFGYTGEVEASGCAPPCWTGPRASA